MVWKRRFARKLNQIFSMYSKPLVRKYINEGLHRKEWSEKDLADKLEVTPSNLSRALNQDGFNLTLSQFASIVVLLEFTPEQITHILTGKKAKEATSQLLLSYAKKIITEL
jgi:DNA-binding Xre family transcriptional regulator